MTIDRPEQWTIDRLHEERGLWALDTARGAWVKVYASEAFRLRPEDFVFCSWAEAARIWRAGLLPVDNQTLMVDNRHGRRVDSTDAADQVERRAS